MDEIQQQTQGRGQDIEQSQGGNATTSEENESDSNKSSSFRYQKGDKGQFHILNGIVASVLAVIYFFVVDAFPSVVPSSSTDAFKYIALLPLAVIAGIAGFVVSLVVALVIGVIINKKYRDTDEGERRRKVRTLTRGVAMAIFVFVFIFGTVSSYLSTKEYNEANTYGVKYDSGIVEKVDVVGERILGLSEFTGRDFTEAVSRRGLFWNGVVYKLHDDRVSGRYVEENDTDVAQFPWEGSNYKAIGQPRGVIIEDSSGGELIDLHIRDGYFYIRSTLTLPVTINERSYMFILINLRATSRRAVLYVFEFENDYELLYEELVDARYRDSIHAMENINDLEDKIILLGAQHSFEDEAGTILADPGKLISYEHPAYIMRQ